MRTVLSLLQYHLLQMHSTTVGIIGLGHLQKVYSGKQIGQVLLYYVHIVWKNSLMFWEQLKK